MKPEQQEKQLFEYAIIRIVPRVEREEFINVGVILYCKSKKYLGVKYYLNAERLKALDSKIEIDELQKNLDSFKKISEGGTDSGPIGQQDLPSRFRWLTATRSTVLQVSPVHMGLCDDPQSNLDKLFEQLVL